MRGRRTAAVLGTILLAAGCGPTPDEPDSTPTAATTEPDAPLPIEGYLLVGDDAATTIGRDADALAMIGVDGVHVEPGGATVSDPPDGSDAAVTAAHEAGLDAELLVGNYDNDLGDFSPDRATELLDSEAHRDAVAKQLAAQVVDGDYDGLQLDLESMDESHTAGLVDLARRLRDELPVRAGLSMALMASDTAQGYADTGYDLEALPESVDRFVLMGYDQHGPDWSDAGPVGGTPWVERTLDALVDTGLSPARIDLGVATFGYRWNDDDTDEDYLSTADARELAGDAATWDDEQDEWTAELDDGTTLWWSDRRTLETRTDLAADAGLHGIALWELSVGDPLT